MCINMLKNQTYPKSRFEVIIVNNDPVDIPPDFELSDNFKVISELKPGSYAARNAGIKVAFGEILAFTDSDCIPQRDWVEQAVALFSTEPNTDRLAGHINVIFDNKVTLASLYEKVFAFEQVKLAGMGTSVTANMWTRKRVFDAVGLFDSEQKSGDDTRWGLTSHRAGFKIIYAAQVEVGHPARVQMSELINKARRVYGGNYKLRGWNKKPLVEKVFLSLYPLRPPIKALKIIFTTSDITLQQKFLVLVVLFGIRMSQWTEHVRLAFGGEPIR